VPPVSKISNVSPVARKIDPISRPEIDLVFQHALADGFYVSEIALLHPGDNSGNLGARYRVQIRKPFSEWLVAIGGHVITDFEHEYTGNISVTRLSISICPPGQHDDLGISCAMLAWAARHPHLSAWVDTALFAHRPRRPRQTFGWNAFT